MQRPTILRSLAVLTAVLVFLNTTAYAQQRFSAGPRIGLNMSNYWGNTEGMSFKPGLAAGAFVMYSSLNHFGISADVLYSQRGAKYADGALRFTQRVNYLEIPIVARYFLTLSGNFRPNVFIGPSVGIKLNAVRVNGSGRADVNQGNTRDFRDADLGATAGFQLNWKAANRQRFLLDARYTLGLSEVQNNLPNLWGARNELRNSAFTLTFGYGFGIGRNY